MRDELASETKGGRTNGRKQTEYRIERLSGLRCSLASRPHWHFSPHPTGGREHDSACGKDIFPGDGAGFAAAGVMLGQHQIIHRAKRRSDARQRRLPRRRLRRLGRDASPEPKGAGARPDRPRLSKIAAKIWRMKSRPEETCRVKFTIVNPDPLRNPLQYIFYFSIVTFIVDDDNVCLSHYVWEHPHYPPPGWRAFAEPPYVPKNRYENWSPEGWRKPGPYVSFESSPVCFDQAGNIDGRFDG